MTSGKAFSRVIKSLITFIVALCLLFAALHFFKLSFTFDSGRRVLVEQIKLYTGRDASIDGEVKLTISLLPQLLVQQIHIGNPEGFSDKNFISLHQAQVEVALLPLLSGKLHLSEITADQAKIQLIKRKDGSDNWTFDNVSQASKPADAKTTDHKTRKDGMGRLTVGEFQLTNVAIKYSDEVRDEVIDTLLDQLIIDIRDRTKPVAEISGNVQGFPYKLSFTGDELKVITSGKPWSLHGSGHIAHSQAKLEASMQLEKSVLNANIDIKVKKVNLGRLLDTLGIISTLDAVTDNISITGKTRGSDPVELYQQAKISLQLGRGYWNLQATDEEDSKHLAFSTASASASWNKPLVLNLDGNIADKAIKLDFTTNRLSEFFDDVQKLEVDLASSIADTNITLKGTLDLPIETKKLQLDFSLKGKDLEKLNPVINTQFPPFNDFSLAGKFIVNEKGYIIKSATASIGESQMQASIVIDTSAEKPFWTIALRSRQLQLKDFGFDDWNIKKVATETGTIKTSKPENDNEPLLEPLRRLEDVVRAPKMHIDLNLTVDKLLSGEDVLGNAHIQLHQSDNIFNLNKADVEIPGGRITALLLLKIENNETSGRLKLDIKKFDYGITARMFEADSQVNGVLSANVDLQLGGSNFTRLLDIATGQVDLAVWPKNSKPIKALNLWTTNLYLVLLPELKKKESKVNCLVGLMDVDNGEMKEQLLVIDTTKLWINGNIDVDFKQEYLKLSLFPDSKTARFFSLQSPIRVQGSFSDIGLSVKPMDIAGSYVSFIASPLTVPTRWVFGDKIPDDGSEICERLFDRDYVKELKAKVDRQAQQELEEALDAD